MIDQIILLLTGGLIVAIFEYYFIVKPKVAKLRNEIKSYKRANEYLDNELYRVEKENDALRVMDKTHINQIELKDKEIEFLKALPCEPVKTKKDPCKNTGK